MQDPSPSAFARLLVPHQELLVVLARRLVDHPDDAEDALQAALGQAFRHRAHFEEGTSFRAWLACFLVNEAANANRRRGRRREQGADALAARPAPSPAPPDAAELEAELAWERCLERPEEELERLFEHLDGQLARALRGLGPSERSALLLRAVAGLSCAEIAGVLETPQGTVMSWLFRARRRLRASLLEARGRPGGVT